MEGEITHGPRLQKAALVSSMPLSLAFLLCVACIVKSTDAAIDQEEYGIVTSFTDLKDATSTHAAHASLLATMTSPEGVWRRVLEDDLDEGDIPEEYRTRWVSILLIILASVCVSLALGSCYFVYKLRNNPIVSVGQPPFLYLICFGSILISSSTYFTAFDEGNGRTVAQLDASCVAEIWFYYCGDIIIYMALISKLWRVHKVTQFRRAQKVLVQHVMGPFVFAMLCSIGILIAWTIKDPPYWKREILFTLNGTATGSYGLCSSDSGVYQFSMALLLFASVFVALWMSCITRHVREDISDSRRVCQTLCTQFILYILGFILLVLAYMTRKITMLQVIYFFFQILNALSSIGFLVFPKIYYVHYEKRTGHLPEGLTRIGGNIQVTGMSQVSQATVGVPICSTASVPDLEIPTISDGAQ